MRLRFTPWGASTGSATVNSATGQVRRTQAGRTDGLRGRAGGNGGIVGIVGISGIVGIRGIVGISGIAASARPAVSRGHGNGMGELIYGILSVFGRRIISCSERARTSRAAINAKPTPRLPPSAQWPRVLVMTAPAKTPVIFIRP